VTSLLEFNLCHKTFPTQPFLLEINVKVANEKQSFYEASKKSHESFCNNEANGVSYFREYKCVLTVKKLFA